MNKINIEVVSDVACPWCFIGKKNLEKALAELPNYDIALSWRPFQLDPTIPQEGLDREVYLKNKFGSMERYENLANHLKTKGQEAGIIFRDINRVPNTLKFHQLLHVANKEGFANELKESLLKAYFENSVDLTQEDEIHKIMLNFGWSKVQTDRVLSDENLTYEVNQEIRHFQNRGVTGVPFFIFNNEHGFSGAQSPETFINIIQKLSTMDKQAEGNSCDVDNPDC